MEYGYNLILSNISYGNIKTINELEKIIIIPLSYEFLSQIYLETDNYSSENKFLISQQSFNPGWLAFYFQGKKPKFLRNHLLINNWANGWEIESIKTDKIHLFFWPQLLEFFGFGLLGLTLFISLRKK